MRHVRQYNISNRNSPKSCVKIEIQNVLCVLLLNFELFSRVQKGFQDT